MAQEPSSTQGGHTGPPLQAGVFRPGDLVLLIDRKGRRHLVRLADGKTFHSHTGILPHVELIGRPEGSYARTTGAGTFLVIRPTLADYVLSMGRAATIIYPKDMGAILTYGDIYPGATVLEAGIGSGALTLALLRAVGEKGRVVSYEVRPEFADKAQRNVKEFAPELFERLTVRLADVYAEIAEHDLDRIVLDVPEPWRAVPHATQALRPGGIFLCYVPTTLQLHRVAEELQGNPVFGMVEQFEILLRPWDAGPMTMRPAHRMVAHTGFITTARRLAGGEVPSGWRRSAALPRGDAPSGKADLDIDDEGPA